MGWALTRQSGFSQMLVKAMAGFAGRRLPSSYVPSSFLLFWVACLGIPAIVLFGPLCFPIARHSAFMKCITRCGDSLEWDSVFSAPPFGVGYYAACSIAHVSPDERDPSGVISLALFRRHPCWSQRSLRYPSASFSEQETFNLTQRCIRRLSCAAGSTVRKVQIRASLATTTKSAASNLLTTRKSPRGTRGSDGRLTLHLLQPSVWIIRQGGSSRPIALPQADAPTDVRGGRT